MRICLSKEDLLYVDVYSGVLSHECSINVLQTSLIKISLLTNTELFYVKWPGKLKKGKNKLETK